MKTHSSLEICAPFAIFLAACALSIPTLIMAVIWMTLGVCALGYKTLDDFPADGIARAWLHGKRRAFLLFYHLAWWPWYMRSELREVAIRASKIIAARRWLSRSTSVTPTQGGEDH